MALARLTQDRAANAECGSSPPGCRPAYPFTRAPGAAYAGMISDGVIDAGDSRRHGRDRCRRHRSDAGRGRQRTAPAGLTKPNVVRRPCLTLYLSARCRIEIMKTDIIKQIGKVLPMLAALTAATVALGEESKNGESMCVKQKDGISVHSERAEDGQAVLQHAEQRSQRDTEAEAELTPIFLTAVAAKDDEPFHGQEDAAVRR